MPGRGVVSALVSNKMLKVKFVDFGNIELYSMSDLRKMSDEFLRFPQLVSYIHHKLPLNDIIVSMKCYSNASGQMKLFNLACIVYTC